MMNEYLIDTIQVNENYRIKVYNDYDAACPITDWDLAGMQYVWHQGYCTNNQQDGSNISFGEVIRNIAMQYLSQKDIIAYFKNQAKNSFSGIHCSYDKSNKEWSFSREHTYHTYEECIAASDLKSYDYSSELLDVLTDDDVIEMLENCKDIVFKYDEVSECSHSVSCIDLPGTIKQIDHSATKKNWKEIADRCLSAEIKEINMWADGEVIGFELEKRVVKHVLVNHPEDEFGDEEYDEEEWEWVDSCWGYYLTADELVDEVIAEHRLEKAA